MAVLYTEQERQQEQDYVYTVQDMLLSFILNATRKTLEEKEKEKMASNGYTVSDLASGISQSESILR